MVYCKLNFPSSPLRGCGLSLDGTSAAMILILRMASGFGNARPRLQCRSNRVMGREFRRKHFDCVSRILNTEWLSEIEQTLGREAMREERFCIALRTGLEQRSASSKAAPGEQGSFKTQRRSVATVRGLGHCAEIDKEASAS